MLYPLWDAGFQVGHAVGTAKEIVERCGRDLHAATALLQPRLVAGEATVFDEVVDRRDRWLRKDARALTRRILEATAQRHARVDRAGWSLAPDIKDDMGGLRDVHSVAWIAAIAQVPVPPEVTAPAEILLAVREALHGLAKRKLDRLHLDLQPAMAEALGFSGADAADAVMSEVHAAARAIEHRCALTLEALSNGVIGGPRRAGNSVSLGLGIRVEDGSLTLERRLDDLTPEGALHLLAAAAATGRPVARRALRALELLFGDASPQRWSPEMRAAFFDILRGEHSAATLELMDHVGAWPALIPEWSNVRGRAQHDPYHRFTVDGHSFIAVDELGSVIATDALALNAAAEASPLENLFLATLLHDIGKGSGGDHSIVGEQLARTAARRMGLADSNVDEVATLVRHHLLLVDTATRRDLDDGAVIRQVADALQSPRLLRLLYILTAADARATGPQGWSEWKAALVRELYRKTLVALETGELPASSQVTLRAREVEAYEPALAGRAEELLNALPPAYLESTSTPDVADELKLLLAPPQPGEVRYRVDAGGEANQHVLTICVPDRPGTLARTAGVLSLHRMSVLSARAYSTTRGVALERFIVEPPAGAVWEKFGADLRAVYAGNLALQARLDQKIADYRPATWKNDVDVRILQHESERSTVVEVRAQDALGLLYAIARALSDLDLDIHLAKIDTLGERVVDVFYVRTITGTKVTAEQAPEIERAIKHQVKRLFTRY